MESKIQNQTEIDKNNLINSAKDLYLKYGVKSVSMDDIARLLGISKKTIYNLITTKDSLVHSVVSAFIEEEHSIVGKVLLTSKNAIDEMVLIARQCLKTLRHIKPSLTYDLKKYHKKSWHLIETLHFNFIEDTIKQNLIRGINEGFYRSNLDVHITSKLYLGLSHFITSDEVSLNEDLLMKDVYENIILYHLHAVMNEKGKKELNKYLKIESL